MEYIVKMKLRKVSHSSILQQFYFAVDIQNDKLQNSGLLSKLAEKKSVISDFNCS